MVHMQLEDKPSMLCYTSYMQTFALLQLVECHVVSEEPIQEQCNPGEDELTMYTIGAEWLCQKTCRTFNIYKSKYFLSYCKHFECDLTTKDLMI